MLWYSVAAGPPKDQGAGKARTQRRPIGIPCVAVPRPVGADYGCKRETGQQRRDLVELPSADQLAGESGGITSPALSVPERQFVAHRDGALRGNTQCGRSPVSAEIVAVHYHLRLILRLSTGQSGIHVQVFSPGIARAELQIRTQAVGDFRLQRVVTAVGLGVPEETGAQVRIGTRADRKSVV